VPDPTAETAPPADRGDAGRRSAPLPGDVALALWVAVGILVALGVLAVFGAAPRQLTAIGIGVLLALALDPVVSALRRRFSVSRAVATLAVGLLATAVFVGLVLFLGPHAARQATQFADELPATVESLYSWPIVGERLEAADAATTVSDFVDQLPSRVDVDSISEIAGDVLSGIGAALLVLITAISVLLDGEAMVARVRRLIPAPRRERADHVGRIVYRSIARYFAGSVLVAVLNGTFILTVGLALGVPLAPLAAVWAAITNLIPQIGGFLGGSFFVLLATTQSPVKGLIALGCFLAYQQLENHLIQPTVIGRAVHLTPPTTMLAALIGGAAAGVPGALVATPLIGAAKSVWMDTRGGGDESGEQGSGNDGDDGDADGSNGDADGNDGDDGDDDDGNEGKGEGEHEGEDSTDRSGGDDGRGPDRDDR
jgi:predicted PurR-regulated permease PerM